MAAENRRVSRRKRWVLVAAACLSVAGSGITAAMAAGSAHAVWTMSGANPAWTGTVTVAATGFPAGTVTTDSNSPSTPTAAFLNADTPYGAVFGSTQGMSYLNAAAAAGQAPSTTTYVFATPTPASGWGFALGDIDADQVQIAASGPGGPLTVEQLGFQGTFNYCTATTPRPAACNGGEQTDVPTWDPVTATLVGNVADTAGAAGWFRPAAAITSLTLTYSVLSGIPSFQTWMASLTFDISGTVSVDTGAPTPAGTTLLLRDENGAEVATTSVAEDGSYAFPAVAPGRYVVHVIPTDGHQVVGDDRLPAEATAADVPGVDFVLQAIPPTTTTTSTTTTSTTSTTHPPTTTTTTTTTSTTSPSTTSTTSPPASSTTSPATTTSTTTPPTSTSLASDGIGTTSTPPNLPSTGGSTGSLLAFAAIITAIGAVLVILAGRRPRPRVDTRR